MKSIVGRLVCVCIALSLMLSACGSPTSIPPTEPPPTQLTSPDTYGLAGYLSDDETELIMAHTNGERLLMTLEPSLQDRPRVTQLVWTSADGQYFVVTLGADGLPEQAVSGGYLFLYSNYSDNKVDITVIAPDGTTSVERRVPVAPSFSRTSWRPSGDTVNVSLWLASEGVSFWELAKTGLYVLSVAGCAAAIIGTVGGAALLCTGAIIATANRIIEIGSGEPSMALTSSGVVLDTLGCAVGSAKDCAVLAIGAAVEVGDAAHRGARANRANAKATEQARAKASQRQPTSPASCAGLTPEECANVGRHYYAWERHSYSSDGNCGEEGSGTRVNRTMEISGGTLHFEDDPSTGPYMRIAPNTYRRDDAYFRVHRIVVFNLDGYTLDSWGIFHGNPTDESLKEHCRQDIYTLIE